MRHALRLPEVAAANLLIGPPFHLSPSLFPCTAASSHSAPPRPPCLAERRPTRRRDSALSASLQRFPPETRREIRHTAFASLALRRHASALSQPAFHVARELLSLTQYRCSRFPSLRQLPRPNLTSSSPPLPPSIRSLVGQLIRRSPARSRCGLRAAAAACPPKRCGS